MSKNLLYHTVYFINTLGTYLLMVIIYVIVRTSVFDNGEITDFGWKTFKVLLLITILLAAVVALFIIIIPKNKLKRNNLIALILLVLTIGIYEIFFFY